MIDLIIFNLFVASSFTFGKKAILYSSPFFLTTIRMIPGGLCLLAYNFFNNVKINIFSKKEYLLLLSFSFFIFLLDGFRLLSLSFISSHQSALIASFSPFIMSIFAYFFLNEKLSLKKFLILTAGFSAVVPVIIENGFLNNGVIKVEDYFGYAAILISIIGNVLGSIILKKLTTQNHRPFLLVIAISLTGSGFFSLIASCFFESWNPVPLTFCKEAFYYIFYLFVTQCLIAYPWYSYLIKKYPVTLYSLVQLLIPLYTAFMSWLFFKEKISLWFLASCSILFISIYFFNKESKR